MAPQVKQYRTSGVDVGEIAARTDPGISIATQGLVYLIITWDNAIASEAAMDAAMEIEGYLPAGAGNGDPLVKLSNGLVTAPPLTLGGPDSGFYAPAADTPAVASDGIEIARWNRTVGAVFGRAAYATPFALTDGANIALDASLSNAFTVTLGGNRTLDNPTGVVAGMAWRVQVSQGAGGNSLAFGANYDFGIEGAPDLTTSGAGIIDIVSCVAITATHIACTTLRGF